MSDPSRRALSRRIAIIGAALILLAFALRLGAAVATWNLPLASDPSDYNRHARSIADGHGYPPTRVAPGGGPTAVRPPAFPYFLGGMYALTGDGAHAGRLAEVLLGTLVVALAGLVAWQLAGTAAGLATLGITAVYPPLIVNGASLLSEPLFVVLELGAVACALRWRVRPRWSWVAWTGVLTGLAILTPRIAATGRPTEVEFDRRFVSAAFRFIRKRPLSLLEAGGYNLVRLFHVDGFSYGVVSIRGETGIGSRVAKASIASFWVFLALAIAGAFTTAARAAPRALWLVPIVLMTPVFILSGTRLRAPVDPFIAMLAGFAIVAAIGRSRWSGYLNAWSTT